jgi:thymidylate kinase
VWHYFGCDFSTGALVHVHLFSRVLSGESFVKSHELPFRAMLLDHTTTLGSVRVPAKAAELVLFVVRTFVKYGSLPDLIRTVRADDAVRAEFRWLEERTSIAESLSLLTAYCPRLDAPLFLECVHALHNGDSLWHRMRLAWRVRRRLRDFAVRGRLGRLIAYLGFAAAYARRKLTRSGKGKVWRSGGAVIAFVGADATGKSTLVAETARWLGSACAVRTTHLGKPSSSLWTLPVNGVLTVARKLRRRKARWKPKHLRQAQDGAPSRMGPSAIVFAVRAVVLAFERRRAVRKARRAAASYVVLCDRYPTTVVGAMDGPRLSAPRNDESAVSRLYAWLTRLEGRLYRGLPQPDVLIELSVSVEAAKQRNRIRVKAGRHTDEDLESRHGGQPGAWSVSNDRRWRISTEGSFEETALAVKHAIWGGM